MARKIILGRTRAFAASLALAGAAIFGSTTASAQTWGEPGCYQAVEGECTTQWAA